MTRKPITLLTLAFSAFSLHGLADTPKQASPGLETITVIGEKTERSLMDTASSVAVFDDKDFARRAGLDTASDILKNIPNLVGSEPSNLAPAVRGTDGTGPAQGADAFFAGTRPRLNYQVDGRTLSYNESIFSDSTLWDVERVEVFRGPQSTLQGRNAIAGAVVIRTKSPTYHFEGGGRLIAGEHNTRQASAYLSGPIIQDQLAFRLAVDRRTSDSFIDFTPYPGVADPEEYKYLTVRGKLLFEPQALPDFSALLTLNHSDNHAPQGAAAAKPYDDFNAAFPDMPRFGTLANGGILDANWYINPAISLQTVISYTDLLVSREALSGTGNLEVDVEELVIEPRLKFSSADNRFNGFVGLHYFRSEQDEFIDLFGGGTFEDSTDTNAIFGEVVIGLTERLDLTLGGRYEEEKRDRTGGTGPFMIMFKETYSEFLPKASLAWSIDDHLTVGTVVARGYNGGGAGFTYDPPFVSYAYEPEYVWNYELFARSNLLDNRLLLTGNLFYNQYEDMQLPFDLNPDPTLWSYVVRNADEAITYGAEVESRLQVMPNLEVFANLGLLKTEVSNYSGSGIEGNDLPRSPAYTFNVGINYEHSSGLELSLDARASDAYYSTVTNEARGKTDPYYIANAKVGYRFEHARFFVAVTNIFDRVEPVLIETGATAAADNATLTQPRTVSFGIETNF